MRALVTGFAPFGGESINFSYEAVRRLPARIGDMDVVPALLPTSYTRAGTALEREIARSDPAIVLCVGEAGERTALNIERVAINVQDAHIADNDGMRPRDAPVMADGPAAYFSTLPINAIAEALRAAGLAAEVSNSAGTFVCNHVFYSLMHLAAHSRRNFRAGFIHVPRLDEQAMSVRAASLVTLDDVVRGIRITLEVAQAHAAAD